MLGNMPRINLLKRPGKRQRKMPFKDLGEPVKNAVGTLREERATRTAVTGLAAGGGLLLGSLAGVFKFAKSNAVFSSALLAAGVSLGGAVILGGAAFKAQSQYIKIATAGVGAALGGEVKDNKKLGSFLKSWKYVIIKKDGGLAGTNSRRFFERLGRLRLEKDKILNGTYATEYEKLMAELKERLGLMA